MPEFRVWEHVVTWLRHYATVRKVTGSSPDEVDFFSVYLILSAAVYPWGLLSLQEKWSPGIFLGSKGRPAFKATTLLPSVSQLSRNCGSLNISQTFSTACHRDSSTFVTFFLTRVLCVYIWLTYICPGDKNDVALNAICRSLWIHPLVYVLTCAELWNRVRNLNGFQWQCCIEWSSSTVVFGKCSVSILNNTWLTWQVFPWSSLVCPVKCHDSTPIGPQPVPSRSIPVKHSSYHSHYIVDVAKLWQRF
jgi:hypothetical protein